MSPLFKKIAALLLVFAVLAPLLLGALAMPLSAQAEATVAPPPDDCGFTNGGFIICGLGSILSVIQNALGLLIAYLAEGIVWAIEFGTRVLELPAVQAGFNVTLSLVNLVFVMALIVIAFQIILDYHASDAKAKLAKLIIAALLINFSLLIAGFLLDISNVFTLFFLKGVSPKAIYDTLDPYQFKALGGLLGGGGVGMLVGQIFGILFTGVILVILTAVFATALVRILYVAVLLLLMPLTWGFWVFPGLSGRTEEWWKDFLKWGVNMLPTMTFFIYIALATSAATRVALKGPNVGAGTGFFNSLLQLLILGGLMIAGLKVANSAGGITSTAAIGAAGKTGRFLAGMAANRFTKPYFQAASNKISKGITEMAGSKNLAAQWAGKALVLGGAAEAGAKYAHSREHDLEEGAKARYGSMSKKQLSELALTATSKEEKTKILMMLAKQKGGIKELANTKDASGKNVGVDALARLSDAYSKETHKDASELDGVKDVVMENPSLAPQFYIDKTTNAPMTAQVFVKKNGISKDANATALTPEVVAAIADSKTLQRQITLNNSTEFNTKLTAELTAAADAGGAGMKDVKDVEKLIQDLDKSIEDATKTGATGRIAGPAGLLAQRRTQEGLLTKAKATLASTPVGKKALEAKNAMAYIEQIQGKI